MCIAEYDEERVHSEFFEDGVIVGDKRGFERGIAQGIAQGEAREGANCLSNLFRRRLSRLAKRRNLRTCRNLNLRALQGFDKLFHDKRVVARFITTDIHAYEGGVLPAFCFIRRFKCIDFSF